MSFRDNIGYNDARYESGDMADDDLLGALEESEAAGAAEATGGGAAPADEPKTIGEALGQIDDAAVMGVDIDIVAVLGTAELKVSQILQLGRGAVVELERLIGEPVDVRAERQLVARGEGVVVEDRLAIQLTEVIRHTGPDD